MTLIELAKDIGARCGELPHGKTCERGDVCETCILDGLKRAIHEERAACAKVMWDSSDEIRSRYNSLQALYSFMLGDRC